MATMLNAVRTVAPATTPVSVAEAKAQMGIDADDTSQDTLIGALIASATEALELELGRALVTQTWRVDYDGFCDVLVLPMRPVQSITSITYYDAAGDVQTASTSLYGLYASSRGSHVALLSSQSWPATYVRADAVRITFVAGYGNAAAVPAPIRQAVILATRDIHLVIDRDPNLRREDIDGLGSREWFVSEASVKYASNAMKSLLGPYWVPRA